MQEGFADLTFPDEYDRPLLKAASSAGIRTHLAKAAELPDLNFHCLRHPAAGLLLVECVHPKVVSDAWSTMQASAADAFDHVSGRRSGQMKGTKGIHDGTRPE
jgi:hypothetical protein